VTFDANSPFRQYGPFIAVSPRDPDLVLLGTPNDGLWRSEDGGRDWTRVATAPGGLGLGRAAAPRPGLVVWFSPDGAQIWAMSAGDGVSRSLDGGRTFKPLVSPREVQPTSLRHGAFGLDGAFYGVDHDHKKIWKFSGGAWEELTRSAGADPAPFGSVAVNPADGSIYVFDEGGHAIRSDDGGRRWSRVLTGARVGKGDPPWLRVADQGFFATGQVVFDPVVRGRLWNAAGTGVYFGDIARPLGNITWESQARGIEELVANDVSAAPGQLPLFAAWDFGIHRRDDLERFSTGYGPKERVLIAAQQLDWTPAQPGFFVTNASDTRTDCCSEDGDAVLAGYSEDGGKTWSKFATLPRPPGTAPSDPWRMAFGAIAVAADDARNIVWAPTHNRSPFYTTDLGRSWRRVVLARRAAARHRLASRLLLPPQDPRRRQGAGQDLLPGAQRRWPQSGSRRPVGHPERRCDTGQGPTRARSRPAAATAPSSGSFRTMRAIFFSLRAYPTQATGPFGAVRRRRSNLDRALRRVQAAHDIAFGKAAPEHDYPAIYVTGRIDGQLRCVAIDRQCGELGCGSGEFPVGALDEVVVMDADKDVFGRVYLGFKGSGWRFGQPSACKPSPYTFGDAEECYLFGIVKRACALISSQNVSLAFLKAEPCLYSPAGRLGVRSTEHLVGNDEAMIDRPLRAEQDWGWADRARQRLCDHDGAKTSSRRIRRRALGSAVAAGRSLRRVRRAMRHDTQGSARALRRAAGRHRERRVPDRSRRVGDHVCSCCSSC
jgi:photosystem II stability/assembly factor-like uncharacterized protein